MIEPHQDEVNLRHTFEFAYKWLQAVGMAQLDTAAGTRFTAQASITSRGPHSGEPVIRFLQRGIEYARAYKCCWGRYYNCNRTRIGMYCQALDKEIR